MTSLRTLTVAPPADDVPRLALRPRKAARSLDISDRTLWTLTKAGLIPCIRVGGLRLYSIDALRDWLREQAARQPGEGATCLTSAPHDGDSA